jgi:Phage integrase family
VVRWHLSCFAQDGDDGLVFTGPAGAPLRRSNFRRRTWLPALKKAELPAAHFHDLRHTGNTLTATAGANLRELMARMGHSSTRAALIYLHSTDERQREIADALGDLAAGELKRKPRRARGTAAGSQPQRLTVAVGAHLARMGAGQQLAGRAHGVDRVALARAALPHVPGAIDLRDLMAVTGQVPGQAQPVVPGALDCPCHLPASGRRARPLQQLRIPRRRGGHLQLRPSAPAGITDRRGMGIQMRIHTHDQVSVLGNAHCVSSSGAILEQRHRPGGKLPRQSCDGSRP